MALITWVPWLAKRGETRAAWLPCRVIDRSPCAKLALDGRLDPCARLALECRLDILKPVLTLEGLEQPGDTNCAEASPLGRMVGEGTP